MGSYTKKEIYNARNTSGNKSSGYTTAQIAAYRNQAKKMQNGKYTITAPNGSVLGQVGFDTYTAIANGKFDYTPTSTVEKNILKEYGEWVGYGKSLDSVYEQYQKDGYGKGNISLRERPIYKTENGDISTVDSITITEDGKHIVIPTIVGSYDEKNNKEIGVKLSDEEAIEHYHATGKYLGKFDSAYEADKYAAQVHIDQALYFAQIPLSVEVDGATKNFGNISYQAYKHLIDPQSKQYKYSSGDDKDIIKKYNEFIEAQAKKEREPENLGQGLLHGAGYTVEKLVAGAVSGLYDIGRFANAGFSKLLSIPAWGSWEDALNKEAENALSHKGPGEMWDESIEERYRVPDWYRDNVGTTLSSIGQLAIPIAAELATAPVGGASPLLEIKFAQQAAKGTLKSVTKSISTKLIKPKVSDAVFGLSAAGSSAKAGYRQSGDVGKSLNYGILNGLGEVATEKLFGGIGGTPIGADDALIDLSKIKGISKLASNKYGKQVLDIAFEGLEEFIMAGADPVFQKATINPDANLGELYKNAGFGESIFQGILLSSLMKAGTFTVSKTINTTNKVKTIKDLNKSLEEINSTLPSEVKFKPLKITASADEINGRYSDIQRVKGINLVNGATNGINVLFENDADKLEPLKYDSTIEEIKQRQNEIGVFTMAYADVMVEELVKNNPEKFSHIEKISVGDSFKDTKTGYTITVVDRDSKNTTVQIDTGTHTMSKVFSNSQADTFATSGQLVEIEDTSVDTPIAENTTATGQLVETENKRTNKFTNEATEKVYSLLVGEKLTNKGINDIINTPELREDFADLTGIEIAGTRSEQRAIVRNFQSNPENIAKLKQSVSASDSQNATVGNKTTTDTKETSNIVTLKKERSIYSVFRDAKTIYEGVDCITDGKVVVPKSDTTLEAIMAVTDAQIEENDNYSLARVHNKSNSVVIKGEPKVVGNDAYVFEIDGNYYACKQKHLDAFSNGKRVIKANTSEKTAWTVHDENGNIVACFMPMKSSSVTEDIYNSLPYVSEVLAQEKITDETSTKELKNQAGNDTIDTTVNNEGVVDDGVAERYDTEREENGGVAEKEKLFRRSNKQGHTGNEANSERRTGRNSQSNGGESGSDIRRGQEVRGVYHGSEYQFETFEESYVDLGIHFGTKEQAKARLGKKKGNINRYNLTLKNPLYTEDIFGERDADGYVSDLIKHSKLTDAEKAELKHIYDAYSDDIVGAEARQSLKDKLLSEKYHLNAKADKDGIYVTISLVDDNGNLNEIPLADLIETETLQSLLGEKMASLIFEKKSIPAIAKKQLFNEFFERAIPFEMQFMRLRKIEEILQTFGYDGFAYENQNEGKGLSYAVFDNSQIALDGREQSENDTIEENDIDRINYSLESGAESIDAGGESQHKSYGGADFDYSKTTQKIYNNRAWAYTLLSKEDLRLLNEKYYEHFKTNAYRKAKLSDGKTRVIEINNKLLFVSGTYNNPIIEAVLVFNTDNATYMEVLKNILFVDVEDGNYSKYSIRRIKNDRQIFESYGKVDSFDYYGRADYSAITEKNGWGAKIEDGRKAFGYTGSFTIRDGIYRKDESRVSGTLSNTSGIKYSFVEDNEYDFGGFRNEKALESEAENERGNNILNGSEQRNVGERSGKQARRVGKSSRRASEKSIRERQRFLRGLKANQKEERIQTDSTGRKHKFTVVKKSAWNEHMKNLAAYYEAQGVTVEFIDGNIQISFLLNGTERTARGMRAGDTIYVSYNNLRFSPEQIAEHEFIHNKYNTDEVQEAKKQILERMSEEEYNKAIKKISEAYSGVAKKSELEQELVCNILSGMYENSAEYADITNAYWSKAESNISGYDVSQYAESIDAGGESDVEYLDAVNKGDIETAQRMVDEAAKKWGALTDEQGDIVYVYRGDRQKGKTVFNPKEHHDGLIFTSTSEAVGGAYKGDGEVYKFYVQKDGFLEIEGNYGIAQDILIPEELSEVNVENKAKATVNEIGVMAREVGYNGVYVKNIRDGSGFVWADDAVLFKGGSQIKSAAPVTYDDNGNIIPLSKRFDEGAPDIRYSANSVESGEINESRNTQELGEQGVSENNDSVWQRSNDSEGVYERLGNGEKMLYRSQEKRNRFIDWSGELENLDVFEAKEKERAYGVLRKISRLDISSKDSDGRKLSEEQRDFFKYTVAKNSKGELFTLYYATDNEFDEFLYGDFGFHIGPLHQALNVGHEKKKYLNEVYVNIKNPVFISDDTMHWYGFAVSHKLLEQHIISSEEYEYLSTLDGFYTYDYNAEANKEIRKILKNKHYDGIVYNNGIEGDGISLMAFDSNQIKYTSNKNPTTDSKLNYSLADDGEYDLIDIWDEAVETYGAIPEGERPAREVSVPKKISENEPVSHFARTMMEAGVTPDAALSEFERAVLDGTMSHEVITDKRALEEAKNTIRKNGFDQAIEDWSRDVARDKVGKKDLAVGMELYNQCVNNKDYKNAMKIAAELAVEATRAGQALQACRLLKKMSPDGQLYYLEKSVEKMNEEFKEKLGKKFSGIELDETLMEEFYTAESEEKRNAAYDAICQNIADQIPSTLQDKWNSWRYLAMLGNPRTHIRNIIGNAVFAPAIRIKNYIGAGLERALRVGISERTKSAIKSKEALDFAKNDFNEMVKVLQGVNAKYAVTTDIEERRQIFKTKALEKLRTKNFEFLEMEDMWFLKTHYVDALARIITARQIDVNNIDRDTLDKVRAYAVKEAQAATYRDANVLAEGLNKLQRSAQRSRNKAVRATSVLIEGVMPFKKTPLNIAKQGIEYSPVSILTGIYQLGKEVKDGTRTAAEAIDTLSKGITGTGLMILGYFLAQLGMLVGEEEEPEKKRKFDKATGEQSYSIRVGDSSYTIDWAAPLNLSLFTGTALYDVTKDGEFSFKKVVDALSTLPEPLLELSVFSGISDIITSAQYEKTNPMVPIAINMGNNYITQGLPTIGGQISRVSDPTKRNYYYEDKNSGLPSIVQNFIGKASSKIPFVSRLFEPSVDVWGREEVYGGFFERVAENFVSPGYYSQEDYNVVNKELQELYSRTGETDVLPRTQRKYYTESGVEYYMTAEQYTEAKKLRGQKSFELVEKLISSSKYKKMDDADKVKAIKKCYDTAGDYAKERVIEKVKNN